MLTDSLQLTECISKQTHVIDYRGTFPNKDVSGTLSLEILTPGGTVIRRLEGNQNSLRSK